MHSVWLPEAGLAAAPRAATPKTEWPKLVPLVVMVGSANVDNCCRQPVCLHTPVRPMAALSFAWHR